MYNIVDETALHPHPLLPDSGMEMKSLERQVSSLAEAAGEGTVSKEKPGKAAIVAVSYEGESTST